MGKAKCTLQMQGYEKIIQDIERMGGNAEKTVANALLKSGEAATEEFKNVIKKHHYSGLTEETLKTDLAVKHEGVKITLQTGFDINKGGLASILLDKGTPKNKPLNFVRKIKKKKNVKEALAKELEKGWERSVR